MKHPTILPGRQGLPPTSNVPWSALEEKRQRRNVILDFLLMWMFVAISIGWIFWGTVWWPCLVWGGLVGWMFSVLRIDRRKLYAMLLNKPRDISALTTWMEHPWTGMDHEGREYFCKCGRLVELWKAKYFRDSRRYSMVCECGIGHFQIDPRTRPHALTGKQW